MSINSSPSVSSCSSLSSSSSSPLPLTSRFIPDILCGCIPYLKINELAQCSLISSRFNQITAAPHLWTCQISPQILVSDKRSFVLEVLKIWMGNEMSAQKGSIKNKNYDWRKTGELLLNYIALKGNPRELINFISYDCDFSEVGRCWSVFHLIYFAIAESESVSLMAQKLKTYLKEMIEEDNFDLSKQDLIYKPHLDDLNCRLLARFELSTSERTQLLISASMQENYEVMKLMLKGGADLNKSAGVINHLMLKSVYYWNVEENPTLYLTPSQWTTMFALASNNQAAARALEMLSFLQAEGIDQLAQEMLEQLPSNAPVRIAKLTKLMAEYLGSGLFTIDATKEALTMIASRWLSNKGKFNNRAVIMALNDNPQLIDFQISRGVSLWAAAVKAGNTELIEKFSNLSSVNKKQ